MNGFFIDIKNIEERRELKDRLYNMERSIINDTDNKRVKSKQQIIKRIKERIKHLKENIVTINKN
tara:strand:+ start:347 stop:541 length:195 start_codon:yes stop_codon:yes gene_type:complete